jgi:hypothetical protein
MEAGGGWSFLQACVNRDGEMWTDSHRIMENLFLLGIAIEKANSLLPRELWSRLPGGVPYLATTVTISPESDLPGPK